MRTFSETVQEAKKNSYALGHFNISDSNQLAAVAQAAKETTLPAIVGLSEGERDFFPLRQVRLLIDQYRREGIELFLNADHSYSIERVKTAIDEGVDSVVVDGAKLPFAENVSLLKEAVSYARQSGREVLIEGELGYIGQSSQVLQKLPEGAAVTREMMTKPQELQDFIAQTGVDMMAPAVGNIHGIVVEGQPKLQIDLIAELSAAAAVPLVLHGGSGSPDTEFTEAIRAGIAIIHISTDLRLVYRKGWEQVLQEKPQEAAPYKLLMPIVSAMSTFVAQKMRLFAVK